LILSASSLVVLIAVVLVSVKVINHLSTDEEPQLAKATDIESTPEVTEPEAPMEPDMVVAASSAILDRPQDVEMEIQIVEGQAQTVEMPDYVRSPIPAEEDSFAAFLEMEAESLRAGETSEAEMPDHTAAVLSDIELQLAPLNPLDDDLTQPVTVDHLLQPEITELEEEDEVEVGLIFSKSKGEDLTLNGKPVKDLDKSKPSLPGIKQDTKTPVGGLFKGRDKKGDDSKNIWNRSRDD